MITSSCWTFPLLDVDLAATAKAYEMNSIKYLLIVSWFYQLVKLIEMKKSCVYCVTLQSSSLAPYFNSRSIIPISLFIHASTRHVDPLKKTVPPSKSLHWFSPDNFKIKNLVEYYSNASIVLGDNDIYIKQHQ